MRRIVFLGIVIITVMSISFSGCVEKDISGKSFGTLYMNDSGEPKGGWEYTQEYYANLTVKKGIGRLEIKVKPGMGDKLVKHKYLVILERYTEKEMILNIGGEEIILKFIEHDDLWDKWHNHYIASYGIYMDKNETIGKIRPNVFPGVLDQYYIELRLPKFN